MSLAIFNQLESFNPIEWNSHGTWCQRCQYNYNGIIITEDTRFPRTGLNIFRALIEPKTWYTIDMMFKPEHKALIEQHGGEALDSDSFYVQGDGWFARFKDLNKMIYFINDVLPPIREQVIAYADLEVY